MAGAESDGRGGDIEVGEGICDESGEKWAKYGCFWQTPQVTGEWSGDFKAMQLFGMEAMVLYETMKRSSTAYRRLDRVPDVDLQPWHRQSATNQAPRPERGAGHEDFWHG